MSECPHCSTKNPDSGDSAVRCKECERVYITAQPKKAVYNSYFPNCIEKVHNGVRYISNFHLVIDDPGHEDFFDITPGGLPPPHHEIDGWDLPVDQQKWRLPEIPKAWADAYIMKIAGRMPKRSNGKFDNRWWDDVDAYNENPELFDGIPFEEMHRWAERENDRRENGYWFMNKGVAIKITGDHYYYLVTGVLDTGKKPDFRFLDWADEWFDYQEVMGDPDCLGSIKPKHRRGGFTTRHGSKGLKRTSSTPNANMGIVSKKDSDAKQAFRRIVIQLNKGVYAFWKPHRSGKEVPEKEILFRKPSLTLARGVNVIDEDDDDSLDSRISFEATVEHAYDGQQLRFALLDEMGKIEKERIDPAKLWDVIKETLRMGLSIIGKGYILSTVEELTLKGGEQFKYLCDNSRLDTINEITGRTRTGLKRSFYPAEWGFEGFIDEYGIPLMHGLTQAQIDKLKKRPENKDVKYKVGVGACKYLDNEYEQQKQIGKGSLHRRKYPRRYSDCFIADGIGCVFGDPEAIADRLAYLSTVNKADIWRTVNLKWKGGVRLTEIEVEDNPKGLWRIMKELPPGVESALNGVRIRRGMKGDTYEPLNKLMIVLGLDPFDHVGELNKDRSKAALYAFRKHDDKVDAPGILPENRKTSIHFLEYNHRRKNPREEYEDVLMTCWYLGAPILPETNKPGFYNFMRDHGFWEFLEHKPNSLSAKDAAKAEKKDDDQRGVYNTANQSMSVNDSIIEQWDLYLYENVHRIIFPQLLEQLLTVDPKDMRKYDCVVASGMCLLAVGTHVETRRSVGFQITYEDWCQRSA